MSDDLEREARRKVRIYREEMNATPNRDMRRAFIAGAIMGAIAWSALAIALAPFALAALGLTWEISS